MTKQLYIYTLCFIGLTSIYSCCTKKGCKDFDKIDRIYFSNFDSNEIDTLLITSYFKNSNFSIQIDSFYVYSDLLSQTNDQISIWLPEPIDIQYDWKIKLTSNQTIYKLTDFVVKKATCNWCFWVGNDYYNRLESYKVNGMTYTDNTLKIIK